MDMSKRGFMKLMGSLPIVGPSIAKEAVNLSQLNIGRVGLGSALMDGETVKKEDNWDIDDSYKPARKPSLYKRLAALKNRTEFLKKTGLTEFEKRQWSRGYSFNRLDVDLAVNRSMSLTAKMHIQKQRDWKIHEFDQINNTNDKSWILEQLNNNRITKEMKKLGLLEDEDNDPHSKQVASKSYSTGSDDSSSDEYEGG